MLLSAEALEALVLMEEIPRNAIVQLDAIAFLRMLPDNSVDMTVFDPAYESLEKHRAKGTTTRLKESDGSSNAWFPIFYDTGYIELLAELYRVMKPQTHTYIFCDETTSDVLKPIAAEAGFTVWKTIIWVKTTKTTNGLWGVLKEVIERVVREFGKPDSTFWGTFRATSRMIQDALQLVGSPLLADKLTRTGMGYHWRGSCERILFLEKRSTKQPWPRHPNADPKGKGRKLNHLGWKDVLYGVPVLGADAYPTEKPQEVIQQLIANSSLPGQLVLDMFAGSGVVGAAAKELGRDFVLNDIADASIEAMEKRLS